MAALYAVVGGVVLGGWAGDLHCEAARRRICNQLRGRHDQGAFMALVIGIVACSEGLR